MGKKGGNETDAKERDKAIEWELRREGGNETHLNQYGNYIKYIEMPHVPIFRLASNADISSSSGSRSPHQQPSAAKTDIIRGNRSWRGGERIRRRGTSRTGSNRASVTLTAPGAGVAIAVTRNERYSHEHSKEINSD
ncbi:hypothetical protein FRC14_005902 [Serendipita sp. 396]|nr:hypothetical protein FRC14_005902 [Serendipita sp. 396]